MLSTTILFPVSFARIEILATFSCSFFLPNMSAHMSILHFKSDRSNLYAKQCHKHVTIYRRLVLVYLWARCVHFMKGPDVVACVRVRDTVRQRHATHNTWWRNIHLPKTYLLKVPDKPLTYILYMST